MILNASRQHGTRTLDRSRPLLRASVAFIALLALAGCRSRTNAEVIRLGYFPNVTHAPALIGVESHRFETAMRPARLEVRTFNAGPAAIEALLADAIDATYVGPSPALAGYIRSHGQALRVVAGAASGGATFVVRPAANIHGPADLHGKRLGTPQLGNTQDIALRNYLSQHGLSPRERGGDVDVTPMSNGDILAQFRLGHLDGAWVPEPWATRLVSEAGAQILIDERTLWPGGAFATTLLVVRAQFLRDAPDVVQRLLRAHIAEIDRIHHDGADAQRTANLAITRLVGRPLPDAQLASAWSRIDFTTDPLSSSVTTMAQQAQHLGFLPAGEVAGLFDTAALRTANAAFAAH